MANQLQPMLGFIAVVALLVSAAYAQIFARDSVFLPDPPIGDALPDEAPTFTVSDFADSPGPELPLETAVLGSLDTSTGDFGSSEPTHAAAAEEEMDDEEEGACCNVPPATVIGAVGLDGGIRNGTSSQDVEGTAICGANSLQSSNFIDACSLVSVWRTGLETACSGWIAGDRYIATAGHCLYNKERDGFVRSVRIYCNANAGCRGPLTTIAASFSVTSKWANGDTRYSNPWDGGIIKTRAVLPYRPVTWGARIGNYRTNVLVAGYPGQEKNIPNSPCQRYPEYDTCTQFASRGTMSGQLTDGFFTPDIDACKGHSGSLMYDREQGWVTGIWAAFTYEPCANYAVPLRVNDVDNGCNHPGGGVGLKCLAAAADRSG